MWVLQLNQQDILLKASRCSQDEADVGWEHQFLTHLAATGFPAPRPLPVLGGRSWLRIDDHLIKAQGLQLIVRRAGRVALMAAASLLATTS